MTPPPEIDPLLYAKEYVATMEQSINLGILFVLAFIGAMWVLNEVMV